MSMLQRFFLAILPRHWGESMKRDSQAWKLRCTTCDFTMSIWEAGGIRWKAASRGKRTMMRCPRCQVLRAAAVEHRPDEAH
jgi:hypothetical protein